MAKQKLKKSIAVFLSLLLTFSAIAGINVNAEEATHTGYNESYDVNEDGTVSISDVTAVQMHVAKYKIDFAFNASKADIDNDGNVTIMDATYLQLYVSKAEIPETTEPTTVPDTTQVTTEATTVPETTQVTTEPTSSVPATTEEPVTEPTTIEETTCTTEPTTNFTEPTTTEPTTTEPVTTEPTTVLPSTEPTTLEPTTLEPTTVKPTVNVTELMLNVNSLKLGVSEQYQLLFTYKADSEVFEYTYSSADESVATVTNEGVIKAISEGETVITLTAENGVEDTCTVTVKPLPDTLYLNYYKVQLGVGESVDLDSRVPENSVALHRDYYSDNTEIADVQIGGGIVTAKAEGTTNIRCKLANGVEAVCEVVVLPLAQSISLNATDITLGVGETFDLNSYIPSGYGAFHRDYYSDNTDLADVAKGGGLVTAKAVGTTKIRCVTSSGYEAICNVEIKNAPTSLALSAYSLDLKVGQNTTIKSSINSGAYCGSYVWSTSNSKVVTVSGGVVKPMSQGTAIVTLKTYNGVTASCKITVKGSIVKCLDVSTWQGDVDFNKVKADGYNYVLIRAGYGDESSQKDDFFEQHYRNAKAAGLKIGVYWFSYSDSPEDSILEAKACLSCINGKELDMPVFYDLEYEPQLYYSTSKLCSMAKNFCSYIENNSDYRAGVYASYSTYGWNLFPEKIGENYSYWIAKIDGEQESPLDYDIHQYTWTGRVDGISGNVDISYIYNLNVVQ